MALAPAQREHFAKYGFVVVKDFFNQEEAQALADWLDALSAKQPEEGKEAKYYERSPITGEHQLVRVEYVLGEHNPAMTELLLKTSTIEALRELCGDEPVLFKEKINYKLPGCRADKLHQDQAAGWDDYADWFITMAIAVDPNRRDNAALSFLSTGNYPQGLMGPKWQPLTEADPPYQPESDYTLIEANPGDVIFFDCYVPHGSPPNTSDEQRRNIYLTFNRAAAGDLRERYYADKWANYPPNIIDDNRKYRV